MFLAFVALLVGTAHATTPVEELQGKRIASVGDAVTSTDAFDGETWFVFQVGGTSRTGYAFYGEDDYYNIPTGGTLAGIDAYGLAGILFKVIVNSDNTYSLMDGYGNYMAVSASTWDCYASTEDADYTTFTIAQIDASSDATQWYVQETSGSTILDTNSNFSTLAGWDTTVPTSTGSNNSHSFYPVTLEDYDGGVAIPDSREWTVADEAATELEEGTWYLINIGAQSSRAGWAYNAEMAPSGSSMYYNASSQPSSSLTSDQIAPYLFRIQTISEDDNTYAIINGEGTTLSMWSWTSVVAWPYSDVWEIGNCDNDDYPGAFWAQEATYTYYLDNNGAGSTLGGWYASDKTYDGNGTLYFYEVTFSETEKEVEYIEDLSSLENAMTVYIESARGFVSYSTGSTALASTSTASSTNEQFVLYTTDDIDGYYIYNVASGLFVTSTGLSLYPALFSIEASESEDYPWILKTTSDGTELWMNNDNSGNVVVDDWTEVDDGNQNRFVVVTTDDYTSAIETLLTDTKYGVTLDVSGLLTNSMLVKLNFPRSSGGYFTIEDSDEDGTYDYPTFRQAEDTEGTTQQFVLYTTDDIDGYYLYSVAAGQFIVEGSSNYAALSDTPELFTLSQDGYDDTYIWRLYNSSSNYVTMHGYGYGYQAQVTWWYADAGNSFRIVVDDVEDEDVEAAIDYLLDAEAQWLTDHPSITALDNLSDDKSYYLKTSRGGFFYQSDGALCASGVSSGSSLPDEDDAYEYQFIKVDGGYLFYSVGDAAFIPAYTEGDGWSNQLVADNSAVGVWTVGDPTEDFSAYWGSNDGADLDTYPWWIGTSGGTYAINYDSYYTYLCGWDTWGYTDVGNAIAIFEAGEAEAPTVYDVEISALGWRTLALPVATVIQSAVTAYSATSVSTTSVRFDEITDEVLGAEEGVVLYADGGGTFYFPESSETGSTGSIMTGVVDEGGHTFTTAGEAYVLRVAGADDDDNDLGVVFSLVEADETIDQYKAYVTAPADGSSISFSFGGTLVEGIGSVETAVEATGIYYDLQGRRVKNPQKGGIYIVDGKKVII